MAPNWEADRGMHQMDLTVCFGSVVQTGYLQSEIGYHRDCDVIWAANPQTAVTCQQARLPSLQIGATMP